MAGRRFIGGNIPIELFQAMEDARGERGIAERTQVLRAAIALWVDQHPPSGGVSKIVAEIISAVTRSKAAREAMDMAVTEFRLGRSAELLKKIEELATASDIQLDSDIAAALEES